MIAVDYTPPMLAETVRVQPDELRNNGNVPYYSAGLVFHLLGENPKLAAKVGTPVYQESTSTKWEPTPTIRAEVQGHFVGSDLRWSVTWGEDKATVRIPGPYGLDESHDGPTAMVARLVQDAAADLMRSHDADSDQRDLRH